MVVVRQAIASPECTPTLGQRNRDQLAGLRGLWGSSSSSSSSTGLAARWPEGIPVDGLLWQIISTGDIREGTRAGRSSRGSSSRCRMRPLHRSGSRMVVVRQAIATPECAPTLGQRLRIQLAGLRGLWDASSPSSSGLAARWPEGVPVDGLQTILLDGATVDFQRSAPHENAVALVPQNLSPLQRHSKARIAQVQTVVAVVLERRVGDENRALMGALALQHVQPQAVEFAAAD